MVDLFSDIHIWLQRQISKLPNSIISKFYIVADYICVWSANLVLPIYLRISSSKYKLSTKGVSFESNKLIVSLTTFPKRIDNVWKVIETMMHQTIKPDEIHLWLSKEQVNGEGSLPKSLKREIQKGLQVHFVDGDIRSHKKYYYIMQSHPNDMLVTIDDDLFYRTDAIANLLKYHKDYPDCVIANYARKINISGDELLKYETWEQCDTEGINGKMFFGSGGGTLFPPHILHKDVVNLNAILKCCPTADDIWLNAITRLSGKKIIKTNNPKTYLPVLTRGNITLSDNENAGDNGNDRQIKLVRSFFISEYQIDPFDVERL